MDLYCSIVVMIIAWIFLFFSFYIWREEDKNEGSSWLGGVLSAISMLFFFISGQMMLYITKEYVYITSTDVVGNGVIHLTEYQPYSLLMYVFGMIALVWTFVIVFYDVVLPKLKKMGVI